MGPLPDSDEQHQHIEIKQSLPTADEDTPLRCFNHMHMHDAHSSPIEPSYREYSSKSANVPPLAVPSFSPSYPPYQLEQSAHHQSTTPFYSDRPPYPLPDTAQPGQQAPQQQLYPATPMPSYPPPSGSISYGYTQPAPAYPGYHGSLPLSLPNPSISQVWLPPRSRRDGYQLSIAIASTICSSGIILAGVVCGLLLLFLVMAKTAIAHLGPAERFSATVIYTALTVIGLAGGGFSLYHSIRALFRKPSAHFKLPWSWLFLVLYVIFLAAGFTVGTTPQVLANEPLKVLLITLAGIFPALTFLAFAARRVHYPQQAPWTTTWRRFALAIVSGGTLTVVLAMAFELILTQIAGNAFKLNSSIIDNPNLPIPHTTHEILFLLVLVSVIAPVIEEAMKPLAVEIMLGRLYSAAEAFLLGFACGIGFDLIETSGYISLGDSRPWIDTALERSTAGLLHGFGAGMVALGCYYLTHRNAMKNRVLIGLGCIAYAIIQHGIWNAVFLFVLLPAPVGPWLANGIIPIGSYEMQGLVWVYLVESLLMFAFFFFVTGKLRSQQQAREPIPSSVT